MHGFFMRWRYLRRNKRLFWVLVMLQMFTGCAPRSFAGDEIINTGRWTVAELNGILAQASRLNDTSARIEFISRQFLVVPYQEKTLVGDIQTPELLVINLAGVDCFTFIDYVEAMRSSRSFDDFKKNLKLVRYQSGIVDYQHRNHYFTDWGEFNASRVVDATELIGGEKTKKVVKFLCPTAVGKELLPGVPVRQRSIAYIPTGAVSTRIIKRLQTGDYIGIYTNRPDLDVSHTGIAVWHQGTLLFRHASSQARHRKVIDEPFMTYIADKPGIIVLRPTQRPAP